MGLVFLEVDVKCDLCGTCVEEIFYDLRYFYHQDNTRLHMPIRYSQLRNGLQVDPRPVRVTFMVEKVALCLV
jgi:hypothetical protein